MEIGIRSLYPTPGSVAIWPGCDELVSSFWRSDLIVVRSICTRVVIASLAPDFLSQPALCQEFAGIENEYFQ